MKVPSDKNEYLIQMKFVVIITLSIIILIACDGGLAPTGSDIANKTGFGGTVTFVGEWDSQITQTNIVVFKDPLLSEADFDITNLKYLSTSIPYGSSEYSYNTIDSIIFGNIESGNFAYLAVVQTKNEEISMDRKDWFVVGVYQSEDLGIEPGAITVEKNKFKFDVDIICDFNNPPQQPPGGE
ncbi:MAG: hypothetical protein ABFS12_06365 [Bacteroidota bacterium]